ncbi:MAG: hypothetical protein ACUVR6_10630, partial [Anaerolineae bacterium]
PSRRPVAIGGDVSGSVIIACGQNTVLQGKYGDQLLAVILPGTTVRHKCRGAKCPYPRMN